MIEQKELTESNKNSFIRNEAPFVPGEGFFIDVIYDRRRKNLGSQEHEFLELKRNVLEDLETKINLVMFLVKAFSSPIAL